MSKEILDKILNQIDTMSLEEVIELKKRAENFQKRLEENSDSTDKKSLNIKDIFS